MLDHIVCLAPQNYVDDLQETFITVRLAVVYYDIIKALLVQ